MDGVGRAELETTANRLHKQAIELSNTQFPSKLMESTKVSMINSTVSIMTELINIWTLLDKAPNWDLEDSVADWHSDQLMSALTTTFNSMRNSISSQNRHNVIKFNPPSYIVNTSDEPPTLAQVDSNDTCISTYVEIFRKIQINQNWQYEEVKDCFDALLDWFDFRFVKHRKSHLLCKLTELPKWINTFILAYGQTINNGSKLHDFKEDINGWKQSLLNDDDFGYALPMSLFYKSRKMINTCTSSGLLLMLALYRSGFDMLDNNATLVSLHTNTELSVVFDTANSIRGSRPEFNYLYDIDTGMFSANSVHHYIESGFTPIS